MLPKAITKLKAIYDLKLHYFYRLFHKKGSLMSMKSFLHRLKMSVARQIRVLNAIDRRLIKRFPALAKNAAPALKQVINVLEQEKKLLSATKLKKDYDAALLPAEENLLLLFHKEIRLLEKLEKSLPCKKTSPGKELKLLKQVNENIGKLRNAIGNKKEVQEGGRIVLKHLARLQHTEMYQFVRSDALRMKKEVKYVMEHPRETRLKQVFAGIYLVAPFTFDATGALVLLRYVIKYSISKSRKAALKIKASADKRRRHIKVF